MDATYTIREGADLLVVIVAIVVIVVVFVSATPPPLATRLLLLPLSSAHWALIHSLAQTPRPSGNGSLLVPSFNHTECHVLTEANTGEKGSPLLR